MTSTFDFAFMVIGPVLVLLIIGQVLYRRGMLNDQFVEAGSKLVFNLALPALLFISISQADFAHAANPALIVMGLAGTLVFFVLLMAFCHFSVTKRQDRGVVIQGGFRANMGIIGLAYCANTYGSDGLAAASVYLGCVTILYNVLSIFVLNFYLDGHRSIVQNLKGMATNPLIVSIAIALPFSYFQVSLPAVMITTGKYFAQLTLPLALICTGASLQFRSMGSDFRNILISTVSKCLLYPGVMVLIAYTTGFRGIDLGIVLLMCISPTAAASYVMVRALGGNYRLAASIIAVTTLISLPVTVLAYGLLSEWQLL